MAWRSSPREWDDGEPFDLPTSYEFGGRTGSVEDFLVRTDTAALLVLQDGKVRYERYDATGGRDVAWISMSSGARWDEDYSNPESDIFRLSAAFFGLGNFDEFIATAVRESAPGTVCRYNSADTQALATLVACAMGQSLAGYMHTKLIESLGMAAQSHWLVDSTGREAAYFGLNMRPATSPDSGSSTASAASGTGTNSYPPTMSPTPYASPRRTRPPAGSGCPTTNGTSAMATSSGFHLSTTASSVP